jgi:hypothetical protein
MRMVTVSDEVAGRGPLENIKERRRREIIGENLLDWCSRALGHPDRRRCEEESHQERQ